MVMLCVVSPFDHSHVAPVVPPLAVRVTLPPTQNVVGPDAETDAVGTGVTVTV